MSASRVRAGQVFVEIGADPRKFFATLGKLNKAMGQIGRNVANAGARMAGIGAGMAAPIVASVNAGTKFENVLLGIRASTGATQDQLDRIKASSMAMSQALGVGPTQAAAGMLELLKAGMSVDDVLGGAGKAAIQFAHVGNMAVADAAVVMADAMNVFKVSGEVAANTLSAAADSSSTSIELITQSFSQVSAVAALANQSIQDTAAAIAVLANAGIKGSDAGTSLKTMLMRLMAPASDAAEAMASVGLSVQSFRNADGTMKPMIEIIRTLNDALVGMDQAAKDDIFRRIFGQDAIRAAAVLTQAGVDGFGAMRQSMDGAMTVGDKYATMQSGMAGATATLMASLERLAITISDAVGPAVLSIAQAIAPVLDGFGKFVANNKDAVVTFAQVAAGAIAVGGALIVLGTSMRVASAALAVFGPAATVVGLVGTVATSSAASVNALGAAGYRAGGQLFAGMTTAANAIISASASATVGIAKVAAMAGTTAVAGFNGLAAAAGRFGTAALGVAQTTFPVFFAGFNRGIAAGAGFFSATIRGLHGMAMASVGVRTAMAAVSSSFVGTFAKDIAGALVFTYKSFVWWASGAAAQLGQYVVNLAGATGATIASAARMAAAWLGAAATGVAAFVGSAVSGIAAYLVATATAVAGSVASATAIAAAWLAPLAPFALMAAAVAGIVTLAYSFKSQIFGALAGVGDMIGSAASAIGGVFSGAVSNAGAVLGDLGGIATTTFNGIYAAIAEGDLAGAMDVLWLGLQAGWLRGVEALMSVVDPFVTAFQDVFGRIGSEIYIVWDKLYTDTTAILNTMGAWVMGFFDNIANGVMATFDNLVAAIQIAWTRVQGFITGAKDTEKRVQAIKDENAVRAEQRRQERPGIESRTQAAAAENATAERDRKDRERAVVEGAAADRETRQQANKARADERRAATQQAEANLGSAGRGKREARAQNEQFAALLKDIEGATTIDQLRDMYGEYDALNANGRLSSVQASTIEAALEDAQERITKNMVHSQSAANQAAAQAGADVAGQDAVKSKAEVAGTFSAQAAMGMGFGSSLAERTAKAAEETATNTRKMADQGGERVAA